MTKFNTSYLDATPFSDQTVGINLNADTAVTYTIPGDTSVQYRAKFSWPYNANVWVGYKVAATLPSVNSAATTSGVTLRPDIKFVRGGDVLSFRSLLAVTDAGIELLQLPS